MDLSLKLTYFEDNFAKIIKKFETCTKKKTDMDKFIKKGGN